MPPALGATAATVASARATVAGQQAVISINQQGGRLRPPLPARACPPAPEVVSEPARAQRADWACITV